MKKHTLLLFLLAILMAGNSCKKSNGTGDQTPTQTTDNNDLTLAGTASLSESRGQLVAAAAGNKIVFAGGSTTNPYPTAYSNTVDIYDITKGTWTTATLSERRYQFAAAAAGNKIVFCGWRKIWN